MKRNRLISAVCVLSLALSLCAGGCSEKKEEATSDIKTETQKVKKAETVRYIVTTLVSSSSAYSVSLSLRCTLLISYCLQGKCFREYRSFLE